MKDKIVVNMDNLMGLVAENLAQRVDYLMKEYWDSEGVAPGHTVFTSVVHAYQDLSIDTQTNREWQQPDIQELLLNDRVVVTNI